ncbi:hypothetical protein [Nocardiopsis synnemataformans]|uniref:hypothetical protein n=1 Tax=Nocardiopsis synnemataformans TaxID=61305 RepID=UPI003EBA465B
MFRAYDLRPRPTVEAIHVTPTNYREVAAYLENQGLQVTVETPRDDYAPHLYVTAPVGDGRTLRFYLSGRDTLVRYSPDQYGVRQTDMFDADHQLTEPIVGTTPDHTDTPRVVAAIQVLEEAACPLVVLAGPWKDSRPAHNVDVAGLIVLPLLGGRVRVEWTNTPDAPMGLPNPVTELEDAAEVFAAAGYRVSRRDGYLAAAPPQ